MNFLLHGDPLDPSQYDLIAQTKSLQTGEPVPDGWRVLTGGEHSSLIGRVAYAYEVKSGGTP